MNIEPATISGAVIWGVVAGVLTSAFLFLAGALARKVVIPWYLNLVYRGVDLQGKWIASKTYGPTQKYDQTLNYAYTLELRQNANELRGTMIISRRVTPSGGQSTQVDDYTQGFQVNGSTWEGYVTLNMISDDRRSLSFVTSLLKVEGRGESLVGHMAYRSAQNDQVDSEHIKWTRS